MIVMVNGTPAVIPIVILISTQSWDGRDPDISDSHTIPDNHGYVADAPLQNGHID